ncbi:uroporphyrinogen-III C-methyltransferase [Blochmannia endosymbiont of Colobopsis nipponica]|uniref:siroheme synthase CysG n=1 Tax=Blochmannia endosymbiont of Colobopsis nipponica TaxID=2681987 RepID=UPI00177F94FE|nr:siroheme synthase CysG [Blochmannia endosymbiont of Colobopsis nipponica]QOI11246.1 uroporphyrinogen-III C-methyltransferase [Blochmannia endosymbiont of Colobopsis nipponica]
MEYLTVLINLKNRPVLVVGGGVVAARKVHMLSRVGAEIKIVANRLCSELVLLLAKNKSIKWISKNFDVLMLHEIFLVIVATNNKILNTLVYNSAEKRYVLVNVVDDKSKCSFIFPSIINRNPIVVAVSSCGHAPVLSRMLREKFESLLPNFLGVMASLAGSFRGVVEKHIPNIVIRRKFWENMFRGVFADLVSKGQIKEASKFLLESLNLKKIIKQTRIGSVSLVGAGPGDCGLLTLRGLHLLQQADVILYDYLVNQEILDLARRDAKCICVGKHVGLHSISQNKINNLLIELANQGNQVVRLKGGDPFIFGRGGEELEKIARAGVSFQIVPGVTAASGASAYVGIPLTHRNYSHSVLFISGYLHRNPNKLNWKLLACKYQTLVVYMGIINAFKISRLLIENGLDSKTPVAIIIRATYIDQYVLIVELEQLKHIDQLTIFPVLLIIGEIVGFYSRMHWFGQQSFEIYKFDSIIELV